MKRERERERDKQDATLLSKLKKCAGSIVFCIIFALVWNAIPVTAEVSDNLQDSVAVLIGKKNDTVKGDYTEASTNAKLNYLQDEIATLKEKQATLESVQSLQTSLAGNTSTLTGINSSVSGVKTAVDANSTKLDKILSSVGSSGSSSGSKGTLSGRLFGSYDQSTYELLLEYIRAEGYTFRDR